MAIENIQIVASPGTRDGQTVLSIRGPLNIHTIFDFQTAARAESTPVLIVDFDGVPFIDSAGLGALVSVQLSSQKANRKLILAALNSQVKALLDMTHLTQLFRIYPSVHEAENALLL
jgi:anti-sigma B factor antagonist